MRRGIGGLASIVILLIIAALLVIVVRIGWDSVIAREGMASRISGAGATFPASFYKRLAAEYQILHPEVLIDYQSIGSGGGIKDITDKTVHFAGSDAPMNRREIEAIGGVDNLVMIPSCAGAVVPTSNLPGIKKNVDLRFTGKLLADIFLGNVTRWNDSEIAKLNPGITLPDLPITPVWRTDGSGTTLIFTNYLCTQSIDFMSTVGLGKQVRWPDGQGGKGNEGVTAIVQKTPGAIGYVEQGYADSNGLRYGYVQNGDGNMVKASLQSVSAAAAQAATQLQGSILTVDLWNQPGRDVYPIASFTYLIVYRDLNNLPSKRDAQALADFLWWATHDGQKFAGAFDFAPLDPAVQQKIEKALKSLNYRGEALQSGK